MPGQMKTYSFTVLLQAAEGSEFADRPELGNAFLQAALQCYAADCKPEVVLSGLSEHSDVQAFQNKFEVPCAQTPSFLNLEDQNFCVAFMLEELTEFLVGCQFGDMKKAGDALVDLCYRVHGTADKMGLPWAKLWHEVQRANMEKEKALCAGVSKRGSRFDVVKPPGWREPDHAPALGAGPWPTFEPPPEEAP